MIMVQAGSLSSLILQCFIWWWDAGGRREKVLLHQLQNDCRQLKTCCLFKAVLKAPILLSYGNS